MTTRDHTLPVTQYLRPYGKRQDVRATVTREYFCKGNKILESGLVFEAEVLTTGQISLTIGDKVKEIDLGIEICSRGPEVHIAFEKLIDTFLEP